MLRALVVDDESPARNRLRKLLAGSDLASRVEFAGEARDGFEALSMMENGDVDMLFLDIQMPELDGFGVLERIPEDRRPFVVFTTAFDNYAIKAFEANAIDYLLKPISEGRLSEAVSRAERMQGKGQNGSEDDERINRLLDWLEQKGQPGTISGLRPSEFLRQVSVPHKDRMLVIPVERVLSIEAQDGITRMYVTEDRMEHRNLNRHIVNYTLDQMEAHLDPGEFMRVHRSAIVRLDQIKEIIPWFSGRSKLLLAGGHEVIASRTRTKELKDRLTP